ncbi:MAG: IS3 family transposase, partial [Bacteroidetes bacterium]|nr:IS3 family transposase [Bacteroidota bacterium]
MREYYKKVGIRQLCELFGKTRLAYYDCLNREQVQQRDHALVIEMVLLIREDLKESGTAKLYDILASSFVSFGIKLGRIGLHEVLSQHGLLVKRRRYRPVTTDSNHGFKKYPNKISGMILTSRNELWVSDITYIRVGQKFSFLSLVTDAYSRKIIGFYLHTSLSRLGPVKALKMALLTVGAWDEGIYHHSDRGIQYCCYDYIKLLKGNQISISMTEGGDSRENALAERVNGILKKELKLDSDFNSHDQALKAVERAVYVYNELRPHASCDFFTPS